MTYRDGLFQWEGHEACTAELAAHDSFRTGADHTLVDSYNTLPIIRLGPEVQPPNGHIGLLNDYSLEQIYPGMALGRISTINSVGDLCFDLWRHTDGRPRKRVCKVSDPGCAVGSSINTDTVFVYWLAPFNCVTTTWTLNSYKMTNHPLLWLRLAQAHLSADQAGWRGETTSATQDNIHPGPQAAT